MRPDQLTDAWLKKETDGGSFARGQAYFKQGRARVERVETAAIGPGLRVIGECAGSEFAPYEQSVLLSVDGRGWTMDGHCSCPVGFNCKHVVALIMAWRDGPPEGENRPAVASPIDTWLDELSRNPDDDSDTSAEALLYLLMPPGSSQSRPHMKFAVARKRQDGSWSKGRTTTPQTLNSQWAPVASYMQAEDHHIIRLIRDSNLNAFSLAQPGEENAAYLALLKLLETGRLFIGPARQGPVRSGEPRPLQLGWESNDRLYRLKLNVLPGGMLLPTDPPLYLDIEALCIGPVNLPEGVDARRLEVLRKAPGIALAQADEVSRKIARSLPQLPTPKPVKWRELAIEPTPCLAIHFEASNSEASSARLGFDYDGVMLKADDPRTQLLAEHGKDLARIPRNQPAEKAARYRLESLGLIDDEGSPGASFHLDTSTSQHGPRDAWLAWIDSHCDALAKSGWQVSVNDGQAFHLSRAEQIDGEVEASGNDWFSLRFDLHFGGWVMPLLPLITPLLEHYRPGQLPDTLYLDTGNQHYVSVPAERIEPVLKLLIDLFDRLDHDELKISRPDSASLADLDKLPISGATNLLKLARQLRGFSGLKSARLPTTFHGQLRDYQQHGVDWLQFLREHQFGGILADDMGLGKTIQTLAHLSIEKSAGRMKDPCLIVAPTSLMGNWRREAAQFTPKLKVAIAQGPERAGVLNKLGQFDLVLTTYPLLPRDREALLAQAWHYVILDEAQQIKNPKSKAARVVRKLKTQHRLCLTGTPMENHLGELWAQFDFLMPGFLNDQRHFAQRFRTPIEKHGDGEALEALNRRTAPFLLRRTKDRVASELPPKTNIQRTTSFGEKQALLYEGIRLSMEKKVRQAIASRGLARSHIIVLEALLKLRQVCCDPRLLPAGIPGARGAGSAKFELLFDLLPSLLEEGRRVLLFSQFTTMLGLIEKELDKRQIDYSKLTGQTRKREEAIARFTSGQVQLFLISLKAGGVGLNLTEADTVIHYDPWWNPAVEHQATDRAHRIGQDKPVFVYKLLTEGTVEEKILQLQERKQRLAESIHASKRKSNEPPITEETIQALLSAS